MTREEFFFKYGCECKDNSCLAAIKEKCSVSFYRDLDSVIENEYQKGLNDASDLLAYADSKFIKKYYPNEKELGMNLWDLNNKYGLVELIKNWKEYKNELEKENEQSRRE